VTTFGFNLFPYSRFRRIAEMAEVVELAEDAGFDSVNLPGHLLPPAWPSAADAAKVWPEQLTLATYLAAVTDRLKLDTHVLVLPYYEPILLAKALATLDIVSGGRFRLGIGSGWMKAEFRRLRIPYEDRGPMTDEYLRAMRVLWTADAPSFSGRWVSFEDVSFLPRPATAEGVPIIVGGSGRPALRRAAEFGIGWYPLAESQIGLREGKSRIGEQMAKLDRDPDQLLIGYTYAAGRDPEIGGMHSDSAAPGGTGIADDGGPSGLDPLPLEACVEGIAPLLEAGVNHVCVAFAWRDAEDLKAQISAFAEQALPQLR
jgi:probable F420-dependent oxidoreductase